ncbi:hypothetical protein [Burkholderia vietnamiensis]|uniref:hypothetical protein n=1 Tax=Burkholderia vietnamiensis TaxID=60552 RepID=UPI001592B317|nr:hypothetical protein [Burkholderia vietnamiensis]MBH9647546.1 hypothetical protein [Burkholderia vietnamiensis]MBR8007855.1 hypothetical protein [Burkholderia vietnamiensis]MBR8206052.1 hypothetical protein [Burkholderia vietnamiensis]MCA8289872.1 hypothetical protein [Burkholderia vietnamiensis]
MTKTLIAFLIASTSIFAATAAHAAGAALPQPCEAVARFYAHCGADLRALNYETGGDKMSIPSDATLRNSMRANILKRGPEAGAQMCESAAGKLVGSFGGLMMASGMARYEFSNRCQAAMADVMFTAKRAQDKAVATKQAQQSQSVASDAAGRDQMIADHKASTAVQWARAAKDSRMNADEAGDAAHQKLANVAASCPDVKLIEQSAFNSPAYQSSVIFASKQCGYAVSYWPAERDAQITFDSSEIDSWIGYCSMKVSGMTTTCTDNRPASAS